MANKKSSKKDIRRTAKRRAKNLEVRSGLKTHIKKVRTSAAAGDGAATVENLKGAISALDKAVQRGVIHKNQAARRKSRIAKAAAKIAEPVAVVAKTPKAAKPSAAVAKEVEAKPVAEKPAAKAAAKPAAKKPAAPKADTAKKAPKKKDA